ncbi:MAG: transposase [Enterococcus avium]
MIFSPLELLPLVNLFQKETSVGPPITVNSEASIRALLVHYLEGIPTVAALGLRIEEDLRFKLSLGFLYGDSPTSESTFSRIVQTIKKNSHLLKEQNRTLLEHIDQEFDIFSEAGSLDATAVVGHTKPTKKVKAQVANCEE